MVRFGSAVPVLVVSPGDAGAGHLRQPEVENLGVSSPGNENVCGLDVAVHDALGVG